MEVQGTCSQLRAENGRLRQAVADASASVPDQDAQRQQLQDVQRQLVAHSEHNEEEQTQLIELQRQLVAARSKAAAANSQLGKFWGGGG